MKHLAYILGGIVALLVLVSLVTLPRRGPAQDTPPAQSNPGSVLGSAGAALGGALGTLFAGWLASQGAKPDAETPAA